MKKLITTLTLAVITLVAQAQTPAFPGAEGHGRYVTGGRGGKIIHVINLNDSGTGSFREAVKGNEKKTVVFDIGGVIALKSNVSIGANTTIAGQTAPAPGITLRYYTVNPAGNNIIMRFIRIRRGQEKDVNDGADASTARHYTGIMLDHCSFSWSIDEVASFYDNNNFTMQWCTIGESLNNAGHNKGAHGYGGIWGGKLASFHHNLICHVNNRTPRFNGARYDWTGYTGNQLYSQYKWQNPVQAENVDFRNCVVYNCGNGCYGGPGGGQVNIVNNYYKTGPAGATTRVTNISVGSNGNSEGYEKYWGMASRYYINGNQVNNHANHDWQNVVFDNGVITRNGRYYCADPNHYHGTDADYLTEGGKDYVKIQLDEPKAPIGEVTTHSAKTAFDKVLGYAGASLSRDNVDERYMTEALNGTATYKGSVTGVPGRIDRVSDVDGYTEQNFSKGFREANFDTDRDGMPDAWETANGLNPNNAADSNTFTLDPTKYYTNVEVYLNSLVQDIMLSGNADTEEAAKEYYPKYCKEDYTIVDAVNTLGLELSDNSSQPSQEAKTYTVTFNGSDIESPTGFFSYGSGKHNFNSKFTDAAYNGMDFSNGLKMEGSTLIEFTTTSTATVTIVQSTWSEHSIKLDENELTATTATIPADSKGVRVYTIIDLPAGEHQIMRGSGESGIFFVEVKTGGSVKYERVAAKVVWAMNDPANANAYTSEPDDVFTTIAFDSGDTEKTGVSNITDENAQKVTTGIKFRPSGSTQTLTWNVKTAAGLTFTPTRLTGYVNRCGTDVENGINISVHTGNNESTTLGTWTALRSGKTNKTDGDNKTSKAYDATAICQYVIELTEAQQAALTSADGFFLTSTVGVSAAKEGAFGEVTIEGLINGEKVVVEMYTLNTVTAPLDGGAVSIAPMSAQYEAGTEVTLTATEAFGFDFVNWTDADGNVVSTNAQFNYTVNGNGTLTANYKAVDTYELNLTVDGTNDYMVTVEPMPTLVEGKWMYESGTVVKLNANQYEGLVTFNNWSDGETANSKIVPMTGNVVLTAIYSQADIIAGWDFYTAGNSGRKADFAAQDNEGDALSLVNTATGETGSWLDKSTIAAGGYEGLAGAAVNWNKGQNNGDVGNYHWQTKVNAEAFTDINVQFQMLFNYNAYKTYNVEYSTDGKQWTGIGSISMERRQIATFSKTLPAAANNKKELYIRMIADKNSTIDNGVPSENDGNTLGMFFITGTPKLVDDGTPPLLIATVPVDKAEGVSATGKIVLTFDERIKVAEGAKAKLSDMELTPAVSGKTITIDYKGLEYATNYTFTLPANTVSDLTGNSMAKAITLTFTTMERPAIEKGLYDAVVEDVEQLVAAIKAAENRNDNNTRFRIFVKNGTYKLPKGNADKTYDVELADGTTASFTKKDPITYINSSNISFIGESRDGVVITNTIPANETFEGKYGTASIYEGISKSDVFQIGSKVTGTYWQDLTVSTDMADGRGRDIAIQDRGTKSVFKNVCLHGYQDTWTSNNDNGLYYFEDGVIRGRTDYMCGKGDIFFNRVELRQLKGGYAAVPSKSIKYGFVYKNCIINGDESGVDGNYTLGRPWGSGTPIALFIDTRMNVVPSAIGWNEMSNGWPKRFAEFNSMTKSGSTIDLSGRKKTFGDGHENNPVLTAEEALEAGNLHNMYGDWDPTLLTEQAPTPKNVQLQGTTLTWDDSRYARCWAVVKNGKVIDFTIEPKYTVDDVTATYAVRAANEMGGLSNAALAVNISDGIESVSTPKTIDNITYNLQGIRVKNASKGVFIIGKRKMVR